MGDRTIIDKLKALHKLTIASTAKELKAIPDLVKDLVLAITAAV